MENKLLHYKPKGGNLGDCFPLYVNGKYYIYYLNLKDDGTFVYSLIITKDLVNILFEGDVLFPGNSDSYDQTLLSGCIYYDGTIFHAYYSSYGKNMRYNIMEAISTDGINFTKCNKILFEPNKYYEKLDTWRDPEIYYENGIYHMLFCAKENLPLNNMYTGCVGYATSNDLKTWNLKKPLYCPRNCSTVECPDLLKLDGKYVLSYYWHDTKYRVSNTMKNFKINSIASPTNFDFMAAKAVQDETRTIEVGWIPRKSCDCSERMWGGNLAIPKEIYFNKKGQLASKFVDEIYNVFSTSVPISFTELNGNYNKGMITLKNKSSLFTLNNKLTNYYLNTTINAKNKNTLMILFVKYAFSSESNSHNGYQIILDFYQKRLFIREQYRWDQRPDLASIGFETTNNKLILEIIVNDDIIEIVLNKETSLTYRMTKHLSNTGLGISAQESNVFLENFKIFIK